MVTAVQAVNLVKVYPVGQEIVRAVDDVTLEVFSGEMVAIVGKRVSGKSSLLHILGCLQRSDSGQIRIAGVDVAQADDMTMLDVRLEKVGFMLQAFNLMPNQSALSNVEAPLWEQGLVNFDRRERATEMLKVVGLSRRADLSLGQLSETQRQRVAIARALVNDPDVVIADEPTQGLDEAGREEIMAILQRVNDSGKCVIVATHDPGVALYCRRMLRIEKGKVVEDTLVTRRRVVHPVDTAGDDAEREAELVCSRCNLGNPTYSRSCSRCSCPLELTAVQEQTIAERVSGRNSELLGVGSASDDGDVPGLQLVRELQRVPVFAELGTKNLVKILPKLKLHGYRKGRIIIHQGAEGDSFYVIRKGKVEVVLDGAGDEGLAVARLGPGDGFGEMALLTGRPRSANVIAIADVEAWRIDKADFEVLLSRSVSLALYFARVVTQRLTTLQDRITA